MLCSVHVHGSFVLVFDIFLAQEAVLWPLVAVEEELIEHGVEVFKNTHNYLVQDVNVDSTFDTLWGLLVSPILENLADGLGSRKGNDSTILGNAFPVVDEQRLDVIW